ncbi:MAG: hypothetical protein KR126chlam6_01130 [Candidatus Anoxychlamydiales bacterium]|nr:hypothetical protein [Candidatus Anoxychlamydiales bacterium]
MKRVILSFLSIFYILRIFSFEFEEEKSPDKSYEGIICVTVSKSGTCLIKVILENLLDKNITGPVSRCSKEQIDKILSNNHFFLLHPVESITYPRVFEYPEVKKILLIRDPRDIIVSLVDFIDRDGTIVWPQLKLADEEWMKLNRKEKIKAILNTTHLIQSFNRIDKILNSCTNTYLCRFESLVDNYTCNIQTILDLATFLEEPITEEIAKNIAISSWGNKKSWTFFRGTKTRWIEDFDEEIIDLFKNNELNKKLIQWGYEKDNNW